MAPETVFHYKSPLIKYRIPFRPHFWKEYTEGGIKQEERPLLCLHQQNITDLTRSDTLPYLGKHHIAPIRKQKKITETDFFLKFWCGSCKLWVYEEFHLNRKIYRNEQRMKFLILDSNPNRDRRQQ